MNPADYDAWYATPRGRWVGDLEYALAMRLLAPQGGDSLLDAGCGTGWFTRRAAADGLVTTGLDPNAVWLDYARAHCPGAWSWVEGDARTLPFADASFDHVLSIAALCFIGEERRAVAEIVRVARRRFAIGWLNRTSLLYWQKGRRGGSGAYRGARWRSAAEARALFSGLPVRDLKLRSAIFLPSATLSARALERIVPDACRGAGCCWRAARKPDPDATRPWRRRPRSPQPQSARQGSWILSMRLPSGSTTSSRQFPLAIASPVCGSRPDSHITRQVGG